MRFLSLKIIFVMFLIFFINACSTQQEEKDKTTNKETKINGVAQKGPFKRDSLITIYELNKGVKTGNNIQTRTIDDKGSYSVNIPYTGVVLVEATGNYLDEKTGLTANIPVNKPLSLTLEIENNSNEIKGNVNVLTDLASKNIIKKLKENIEIKEATKQAQEVLSQNLGIDLTNTNASELDLTDSNSNVKTQNAQLLKLSVAIASSSNPNEAREKLSADFEDGEVNDTKNFDDINQEQKNVNLDDIAKILEDAGFEEVPKEDSLQNILLSNNNIKFNKKNNTDLESEILSNEITLKGIKGEVELSIINGLYSLNNSEFKSNPLKIKEGDSLRIKHTSNNKYNTSSKTIIKISNINFYFLSQTKTNVDKTAPNINDAIYSEENTTKDPITVTFTSNDTDIITPSSWTKVGNNFTKIYFSNINETVAFTDKDGNTTSKTVSISNIDTIAPTVVSITYSKTELSNEDIIVTITLDKKSSTSNDWSSNGTAKIFTKIYSSNTTEDVIFTDLAGNKVKQQILISNIDKTAPTINDATYSEESTTRDPITVTFTSSDTDVLTPSSWTKIGNKFTKIYSSNINETVTFTDNAGNTTSKTVSISNIDTSNPNLISYNNKDYIQITSPKTGKIWLDRNLGANEVCNGNNLELCSGDYFQWGRKLNGHEKKDSSTSNELITNDVENDGKFIASGSAPFHWENSQKSTDLWKGVNAANNVCPSGFKVPSKHELEAEFVNNSILNPKDSFLKIPASSYRNNDGVMESSSTSSFLWSNTSDSSIISFDGLALKFDNKITFTDVHTSFGIPVRCIKDYEDTTAPTIVSVKSANKTILNGDTNISTVNDITLKFSEEVRAEDIKSSTVILSRAGSSSLHNNYANKIVTFSRGDSDELLEKGYEYTLTVKTTIKDINGNALENEYSISFETIAAPDTTLPMIDFTNSTLGSYSSDSKNSNVSVSNNIKISFNESINPNTINKSNVLLNNTADYTVTLENNKELIITLNSNLSYETSYQLTLKEDIQDIAGNSLNPSTYGNSAGDKTITFVTKDAPDLTAPEVLSSNPSSGSSDIGIASNIAIIFNEEIQGFNSDTVILKKDSDNSIITSVLTYNNKILTINPDSNFEENTAYKVTLTRGIKDSSNNSLANNIDITFTSGTASSCMGAIINNICYEVSTSKKAWQDGKNSCLSENKTLINKTLISNLDNFTASLNLVQDNEYWLEEESSSYGNYIEYYSNPFSSDKWKITSSGSKSNEKYFLCMKESIAPTASIKKPTSLDNISTKSSFKISFNEEVKNISETSIIIKDSNDLNIPSTVSYVNKIATIKPNSDLDTSSTYTITLNNTISDLYANKLVEKIFTFTTSAIAATCDGIEIDAVCYEKSSDELTHANAKTFCENNNKTLISKNSINDWTSFANTLELNNEKKYWLSEDLNYIAKSFSGWNTSSHYSSSSESPYICKSDKIAPTISSREPLNTAMDVSTKASIKITFDKDIKEDTLNSTNIILKKNGEETQLTTTITYSNKVVTIKSSTDFDISSTYTLTLKDGITDLYANALSENIISFTTSSTIATCSGVEINANCYILITEKKSWSDAATHCTQSSGTILSIDNSDLQNIAQNLNLNTSTNYWVKEEHNSSYGKSLVYSSNTWTGDGYGPSKSKSSLQEFICKQN